MPVVLCFFLQIEKMGGFRTNQVVPPAPDATESSDSLRQMGSLLSEELQVDEGGCPGCVWGLAFRGQMNSSWNCACPSRLESFKESPLLGGSSQFAFLQVTGTFFKSRWV